MAVFMSRLTTHPDLDASKLALMEHIRSALPLWAPSAILSHCGRPRLSITTSHFISTWTPANPTRNTSRCSQTRQSFPTPTLPHRLTLPSRQNLSELSFGCE
jgi:hypothetical protein